MLQKKLLHIKIIYFILLALPLLTKAQQYQIMGYVQDINTGERIVGANVIDSLSGLGCLTNNFGYYNLNIKNNTIKIYSTYLGQSSKVYHINIVTDTFIILKINATIELNEIVVASNNNDNRFKSNAGTISIPVKKILQMPSLGEPDLVKSLQNLPGIKGGVEGASGIFVRGGGAGENLFMLDDIPLYNISHFYGFFSTFNSSAIKNIKVIKSGFSPRYGGRASAVIDIRSLDGNQNAHNANISVGLISSQISLGGFLLSNKTTYQISGRRSYFDLITRPLYNLNLISNNLPNYFFHDFNLRLSHTFSRADKIYFGIFTATDFIKSQRNFKQINSPTSWFSENFIERSGWDNTIASIRWNHLFKNTLFVNSTVAYTTYYFYKNIKYNSSDVNQVLNTSFDKSYFTSYNSQIADIILKTDFDYVINKIYLRFGVGNTIHLINPGSSIYKSTDQLLNTKSDSVFNNTTITAHSLFAYAEFEIALKKLFINSGLRFGMFYAHSVKKYNPEPRIAVNYKLFNNVILKTGYARMVQYMHLLSSARVSMPTDLWIPSTNNTSPLTSDLFNLGFDINLPYAISVTTEVYYKISENIVEYKNGYSLMTDLLPWYAKITQGQGISKGIEIAVEKTWSSYEIAAFYTFAKSTRKFRLINNNNSYPFDYDRLHQLTLSTNITITKKWSFSALWTYGTGYPVSLATIKYLSALGIYNLNSEFGGELHYYKSKNNFRMPDYHRLDIGLRYAVKKRTLTHSLNIDIFNAYNRKNPVYMQYAGYRFKALKPVSLLPIIPSISYTLKF